jgi:hypothetical protein
MSHHLPQWAQEMSPGYRGPTILGTLGLLAAVAALLLALLAWPAATSTDSPATGPRQLSPVCAELQRLERHGVHSGPSWRRVDRLCRRASGGR